MSGDAAKAAFTVAGWTIAYAAAFLAAVCVVGYVRDGSLWWPMLFAINAVLVCIGLSLTGDDEATS